MNLSVEVNKERRTGKVIFAGKNDLTFVNDWRKSIGDDQNPLRVDAVDFAQLAVFRYESHSTIEPYAKSIDDIGDHVGQNPKCEVGCFTLFKSDWFPESDTLGIAHFRRTWSNRIVLDYLAAHPFIVRPPEGFELAVRGVGPALLYFLCKIAKRYGCDAIWGEATQLSCGFYKHVLKLDSVEDLIYASQAHYVDFMDRMDRSFAAKAENGAELAATDADREEIYVAEAENPPFVGSKTAVYNPARRLAFRFLELPHHTQREIIGALQLLSEGDEALPLDEQFTRYFRRATEGGKLADLWRRVESHYPDGEPYKNPFPKP